MSGYEEWWLVRLVYVTKWGKRSRFWWLQRAVSREEAGRDAAARFEAKDREGKELLSCHVYSMEWIDEAVEQRLGKSLP